jgi:hypothetical protein
MLPWSAELTCRIDEHVLVSEHLRGNPLGDPHERPLWVQLPPSYDDEPDRRYPTVLVIQGYTGHLSMWWNRKPWRQPYPELVDALLADPEVPDGIVVYADAWTRLGGSQFLDSPATGRYHSYVCEEVVGFVDERYRTMPSRQHRAITGKSSGGYGAMVTALLRPDLFAHLATHAGDALFEACYLPSFPAVARALRDRHDGDVDRFLAEVAGISAGMAPPDVELLECYGYAACYSGEQDGSVTLPFDRHGRLREQVWARWLAHDPVRMAEADPDAVRSLQSVWVDAGTRDEYFLDLGAQAFATAVLAAGLPQDRLRLELFDATHADLEYRYPLALRWLLSRMT